MRIAKQKRVKGEKGISRSERIQAILQGEIIVNRIELDAAMAYLKWKRLLLSDNVFLKHSFLSKRRRFWVHEINEARAEYGEYHHLMPKLREDKQKFTEHFRMSSSTSIHYWTTLKRISPSKHKFLKFNIGRRKICSRNQVKTFSSYQYLR